MLEEKGEVLFQELILQEQEMSDIISSEEGLVGVDEDLVVVERCNKIKDVMLYVWICYEKYVWGFDEFKVYIFDIYL